MPRRWLDPALFTDEKLAKAVPQERLLFTALIANQDDDGRLLAHPGYLRSIAFPYDDFTIEQVKEMRDHLTQVNPNIIVYENSGHEYIQLKRHSRYQRPRYYHPSKLPAPPGWPFKNEQANGNLKATTQLPLGNPTVPKQYTEDRVGVDLDKDLDKGKTGRGKAGKTKKRLKPPSPTADTLLEFNSLFQTLVDTHHLGWGRMPDSRETAQLRDLAKEISSAGGATVEQIHDAFREAATHNKLHISYVAQILRDWLGIEKNRSP